LKEKKDEMEALKTKSKITKLNEIEIEKNALYDELRRLR
jgi:hypothetical protein